MRSHRLLDRDGKDSWNQTRRWRDKESSKKTNGRKRGRKTKGTILENWQAELGEAKGIKGSGMSFDPSDPQDMGALIGAFQGDKQIDLQRQILEMQKLQVLNQVRISQGLPPLAQLPQPPQPKEPPPTLKEAEVAVCWAIGIITLIVFVSVLFRK